MLLNQKNNNTNLNNTCQQNISIDPIIDAKTYSKTLQELRNFFLKKGYIEVPVQSRLSILAACEDPNTIRLFDFSSTHWPLPQTGQMWLEYELLNNPNAKGFFCVSTSYRDEPNPISNRHRKIFPMFEFETHGDISTLIDIEKELLKTLGFKDIKEGDYVKVASDLGVKTIEAKQENEILTKYGNAFLLKNFPVFTNPFWNMRLENNQTAKKVDVILNGQETIGSAERAIDKEEMRHLFYTIMDGAYAKKLFGFFGEERVTKELDQYLSYDFFTRCGGGIGITRLIPALETLGFYE